MPQVGGGRSTGRRGSCAGRKAASACFVLGLMAACASPHDYKFPVDKPDQAYLDHETAVKDCAFVDEQGRQANLAKGLYPEYDVGNHILEASEQGGVNYGVPGDAEDDFNLNFGRIFNCYRKFRDWAEPPPRTTGPPRQAFKQVLIYFNGGLNPASVVRAQARSQVPQMLRDGYYPVFLVWPTGPIDTYLEQITFVRNGVRRSNPQLLRAPLYLAGDIGQGLSRAPVTYLDRLVRAVAARNPFDNEDKREFLLTPDICLDEQAAPAAEPCKKEQTDVDRFGIENCEVTADKNLVTGKDPDTRPGLTLKDLPYYGLFATRFVSAPLVDAFGTTMWENMVRRTRTTIRRPIEYDINLVDVLESDSNGLTRDEKIAHIEREKQDFPNGLGAFAKFFTMLQSCAAAKTPPAGSEAAAEDICPDKLVGPARESWRDIDLTVIGHSMGTIVMNELIPLHPDLPYRNLVFMAAAASVRDTTRAMSPVVIEANNGREKTAPLRFYNLMLHPENDANELVALGAAPSGSLLAWVDEMYENPKTAIDRTMGKWRNLRATRHVFPKDARRNMLLRVFNWASDWERERLHPPSCPDGDAGGAAAPPPVRFRPPTTHSGFNDDEARFWCPAFWGADKVRWWGPGTEWQAQVCARPPEE